MTDGDTAIANQLTLNDAAEELGVHYMTAYRYVRTGRLAATKAGGKWWIAPGDLAEIVAHGAASSTAQTPPKPSGYGTADTPSASRSGGTSFESYVHRLRLRLIAADERGAWTIVNDALVGGASAVDIHTRVIAPAMREIGAGWAAGELSIADEHRASATVTRILGRMTSLFRHPGRRKATALIGSVAGDTHALSTAMLADLLSDSGYDVVDLGADTPADSFIEVAESLGSDTIIGLCCSVEGALGSLEQTVTAVRSRLGDVGLFVGGLAAPHIAATLPIDGYASTGEEAIELFDRYLAR